jgi:UDP-glucuronate decarboxylase
MHPDDGRVVSNFIVQALQDKDITIYGDGFQTRSFCYVSDLIEGIYKTLILEQEIDLPINLGNPNEFTMNELAGLIVKLTKSKSKIVHETLPEDDPKQRKPDIRRAQDLLDWEPNVQLEEGLGLTINYFQKKLFSE